MVLTRLFDYARLALGQLPDQDELSRNVEYWKVKNEYAEQGICYARPMYRDQQFDMDTKRGQDYLNLTRKESQHHQSRYDFFFGSDEAPSEDTSHTPGVG